jgi:hypothetical protein
MTTHPSCDGDSGICINEGHGAVETITVQFQSAAFQYPTPYRNESCVLPL